MKNYGSISSSNDEVKIPKAKGDGVEAELLAISRVSVSQDHYSSLVQLSFIQLATINDDDLLKAIGMDAYVFLRFLKLAATVLSITSFLGLIILLPVYFTGEGNDNIFGINLYSMANLKTNSSRLWASWVFTYVYTIIFLYFIHLEYKNFAAKRKQYFKFGDEAYFQPQTSHTVQVSTYSD